MNKITVFCGSEPRLIDAFSGLDEVDVRFAAREADIAEDSEAVILSQDYAADHIVRMIRMFKAKMIPTAVATFDRSEATQDLLLDYGADDVVLLPMSRRLLQKRLVALTESSMMTTGPIDFAAFDRIREANQGRGAFIVHEKDFTNIYRFVSRILERLDKSAQMIIFNFSADDHGYVESDDIYNFVKILQACLRRGDISAICGKQVLLILMGTDTAGGEIVVKRLLSTFEGHYYDSDCTITYEMRQINS